MAKLDTVEEAAKIREQVLADSNRLHDHIRTVGEEPGKPGSLVRALGRRHDNHLVGDAL